MAHKTKKVPLDFLAKRVPADPPSIALTLPTMMNAHQWPEMAMEELVALIGREDSVHYGRIESEVDASGVEIARAWRHKICDWFYEFVDHYNFDREVVGVALNYFDRYVYKKNSSGFPKREMYQLIAMSSLFLAIKVHAISEDRLAETRSKALSRLLYGHFEPEQILAVEQDILHVLGWHVNPPTMHQLALAFSQIHPLKKVSVKNNSYVYEAARYQVELAVFVPHLLQRYKPSTIVYAAMLNAMENVDPFVLTAETQDRFMSLMHIPEIGLDQNQVAAAKEYIKNAFPVPDLSMELNQQGERLDTASPTNVSEF